MKPKTGTEPSVSYLDTTLRDGGRALDHDFTAADCRAIVSGLVAAGVRNIELCPGLRPGLSRAAVEVRGGAELFSFVVPGIAVLDDLREVVDFGLTAVRVAALGTDAEAGLRHIEAARNMGLVTHGLLMMTHMADPEVVAEQGRLMEIAGAQVITLADSAGYQVPDDLAARVSAVRAVVTDAAVGVRAHNNLGLAIGNSLAAIEAGASWIDGTCAGLGAGGGGAIAEALIGALDRRAVWTGVDAAALIELADRAVWPLMKAPQIADGIGVTIGTSGVYSSFLRKANALAGKYQIDPRVLLIAVGKRHPVAGQEDLLEQIALDLVED